MRRSLIFYFAIYPLYRWHIHCRRNNREYSRIVYTGDLFLRGWDMYKQGQGTLLREEPTTMRHNNNVITCNVSKNFYLIVKIYEIRNFQSIRKLDSSVTIIVQLQRLKRLQIRHRYSFLSLIRRMIKNSLTSHAFRPRYEYVRIINENRQ